MGFFQALLLPGIGLQVLATVVILLTVSYSFLLVYRVYLHPLSKIPGPKIAAATSWYDFYYQCIKKGGGQFTWKIAEMHDHYGEIPLHSMAVLQALYETYTSVLQVQLFALALMKFTSKIRPSSTVFILFTPDWIRTPNTRALPIKTLHPLVQSSMRCIVCGGHHSTNLSLQCQLHG